MRPTLAAQVLRDTASLVFLKVAALGSELKGLDPDHQYLRDRGIEGETARFFGIGVADRGSLKGRLAIPLHEIAGRLVGYAGRILDDSEIRDDNPKYLFRKRTPNPIRTRHGGAAAG